MRGIKGQVEKKIDKEKAKSGFSWGVKIAAVVAPVAVLLLILAMLFPKQPIEVVEQVAVTKVAVTQVIAVTKVVAVTQVLPTETPLPTSTPIPTVTPTPTPPPVCPLRGKLKDGKHVTCYTCYQCDVSKRACDYGNGVWQCEVRFDETKPGYYTMEQEKFLADLILWENLTQSLPTPVDPIKTPVPAEVLPQVPFTGAILCNTSRICEDGKVREFTCFGWNPDAGGWIWVNIEISGVGPKNNVPIGALVEASEAAGFGLNTWKYTP